MPTYRRSGGSVTRSHLRVRVGGSALGAGRRIRTPIVDPPPVPTGTMTYTAEPLGAGGWVTGLTISPDGLTRLTRTDTLGAWRWDSVADTWKASVTGSSMPAGDVAAQVDSGMGVQGIVATNSVAFMAYRSSIYKSTDKGATWTVSLANGPATAPNSGEQRWHNDHMAFDPNNSAVCLYGTYSAGLWYTKDTGATWTQVPAGTVPFGTSTWGIPCVEVDQAGNWYAAPFGSGVYRSTDAGATWAKISSDAQFTSTFAMKAGANGDLLCCGGTDTSGTAATSVAYRYRSGAWANITPSGGRKWRTVAYDPNTPGQVHIQGDGGYHRRSTDYGTTWVEAFQSMTSPDNDVPWLAAANGYGADFFFTTIGGLQFDPVVPNRLWMSEGIGVWYADLPTTLGNRVPWVSQSRGIEQLVVNDVLCPPGGPPVVVCWDRSVFLAGEWTSAPVVTIATPQQIPVGSGGSLQATLVRGFPLPITYAWTVLTKPAGSTGGTLTSPTGLSTAFIPDVTGSYTLRLTATNTAGSTTNDIGVTAIAALTGLSLPGVSGNYLQTPSDPSLDITGSLTLVAKLSMASWTPSVETAIIAKAGSSSKAYSLTLKSTGFRVSLLTNPSGASGLNNDMNVPLGFPPGSVQWVRMVYDATAQTVAVSTSADGTTWTLNKSVSTSVIGTSPLAVSTAPLTVGWAGAVATSSAANAHIYRAMVYSGATLVADFNAEAVTRTGTRTPATYTGVTGKVWTPQGSSWDWST